MVAEGDENISKLTHFFELKEKDFDYKNFVAKPIKKSDKKKLPAYNNWSQEQKNTLHRICGDLMKELGYK